MKRDRAFPALLVSASLMAFLAVGLLRAQKIPGLGTVKKKLDTFSLKRLLEAEPPISTSLDDAVTEVPFLDDFNPPEPSPMTLLPRAANGNFILVRPGIFAFTAASYCLQAGTYAPAKGEGYIYAPLKGKRAEIVGHILENSVSRLDVPQKEIQYLLWAIVARTKFTKMTRPTQLVAAKLLTPAEIAALSGASLDAVPDAVLEKAMAEARLPAALRDVLRAESRIRDMMTRADTSYADLEKVAVLAGNPLPGERSRDVASGRWSFHPGGYFIRYYPRGYSQTDIQINVPGPFNVERDPAGRIAAISDDGGSRITFVYNPAGATMTSSGGGSLKANSFRSIAYSGVHPWRLDEKVEGSWTGGGWALSGFQAGPALPGDLSSPLPDSRARLDRSRILVDRLNSLAKVSGDPATFLPPDREALCLEIGSLCDGLRDVLAAGGALDKRPGNDAYAFLKRAWQSAMIGLAGPRDAAAGPAGHRPWPSQGGRSFAADLTFEEPGHGPSPGPFFGDASPADPGGGLGGSGASFDAATPGNTARQRLGESARPADPGCMAIIGNMSGDVKLNGMPATERMFSGSELEGGNVTTGRKGRVQLVLPDGSTLRMGSNSKMSFPQDLCQKAKESLERQAVFKALVDDGFLFFIPGTAIPFEIVGSAPGAGVRGDLRRLIQGPNDRVFLASLDEPPQEAVTEAAIEGEYNDLKPGDAELAVRKTAVFIGYKPGAFFYVRAARGTVSVDDPKSGSVTLKEGEHVFVRLTPGPMTAGQKGLSVRPAKGR
jgi:YD repeat-containing protein